MFYLSIKKIEKNRNPIPKYLNPYDLDKKVCWYF